MVVFKFNRNGSASIHRNCFSIRFSPLSIIAAYDAQYEFGFLFVVVFRYHSESIGGLLLLVKGLYDYKKSGKMPLFVVGCEFDSEHIPRSLLRGKRANTE